MTRAALLAIVAAAAAIRIAHYAAIADTAFARFPLVFTESDLHAFWSWAREIAAGDWLGRDTYHPSFAWMREMASTETWERWWGGKEIFHQAPLYPYFVAAVLAVSGAATPGPVLLAQLAIGALQPLVLFALGRRLADERAGLVAAGLCALHAPLVFHQGVLLRDWLPPLLEPLALLLLLRAAALRRTRDWIAAGAGIALAWLTRETALLLLPAAALWLVVSTWPRVRETAAAGALLALGFAAASAPLVARNAVVGAPLLSTSNRGGVTFVQHNAAPSSALWSELDPVLQKRILAETDGDGGAIVRATLATYGGDHAAIAAKLATKLRGALDPVEIPSNVGIAYGREISPVLRALPGFGLVFPLGAIGLLLSLCSPRRHLLLHLYLGITVATIAISLPLARYRLPLATALMLYAGLLVSYGSAAWSARRWRSLALGAAGVAAAALLQHFVLAVPELRSAGWMAMYGGGVEHRTAASVYLADGEPDRAADELRRLRARANDDPWTHEIARAAALDEVSLRIAWAERLIGLGRMDEARVALAEAERLDREHRDPAVPVPPARLYELGALHDQLGDADRARAYLTQLLEREPAGPRADAARRLLRTAPSSSEP